MADMPSSKLLDSFKSAVDEAALVSVLRNYKNQIIGNKHKKSEFQAEGIVPAVIQLASQRQSYPIWQQIAAIVYSMAAGGGPEAVQAIQDAHGPDMLLQMLCADGDESEQVVLGAARALTALYDVRLFPGLPFIGLPAFLLLQYKMCTALCLRNALHLLNMMRDECTMIPQQRPLHSCFARTRNSCHVNQCRHSAPSGLNR